MPQNAFFRKRGIKMADNTIKKMEEEQYTIDKHYHLMDTQKSTIHYR